MKFQNFPSPVQLLVFRSICILTDFYHHNMTEILILIICIKLFNSHATKKLTPLQF